MSQLFALLSDKDYREAHAVAIQRLEKNGRDAEAVCALGLIAFEHDNRAKGLELMSKAAQLSQNDAYPHAQFGRALTLSGRQNEARKAAEIAADIAETTDDARAHVNDMIGVIFSRVGLHAKAVPFFARAAESDPGPANYHYNLAASLQFSGDFEAAEQAYLESLKREPDNYRAMSSLTALNKQTADNHLLSDLKQAFDRLSDNADASLHIGHAIAKTLEDLGQFPESLDWLARAKAKKAREIDYSISQDLKLISAAQQTFPAHLMTGLDNPESPIFVTGLPRTGTTLVERILSSHPDAISVGELNAFADQIKRLSGTSTRYVLDPPTFEALGDVDIAPAGAAYMDFVGAMLSAMEKPDARSIDKMPLNILNVGLIHRALPNARIIVLRRGAMDSCLSNYRQLFSTGHSYYNYSFDLNDTAHYYRAFDGLVAHWAKHLPADRFMQVKYEDIIFDQEVQTRRMLEFCGLNWDERCLRFHENNAPVSTASSVQVRQPLYSGSIGRWKRYGNRIEPLRRALGDLTESDANKG